MKKQTTIIFTIGIFLASFTAGFAQDKIEKTITFKFKNNSILPHKYTFITYAPNQKGNGTFGDVFVPFGTKEFNVKIGTKIYLAKRKQVSEESTADIDIITRAGYRNRKFIIYQILLERQISLIRLLFSSICSPR